MYLSYLKWSRNKEKEMKEEKKVKEEKEVKRKYTRRQRRKEKAKEKLNTFAKSLFQDYDTSGFMLLCCGMVYYDAIGGVRCCCMMVGVVYVYNKICVCSRTIVLDSFTFFLIIFLFGKIHAVSSVGDNGRNGATNINL